MHRERFLRPQRRRRRFFNTCIAYSSYIAANSASLIGVKRSLRSRREARYRSACDFCASHCSSIENLYVVVSITALMGGDDR